MRRRTLGFDLYDATGAKATLPSSTCSARVNNYTVTRHRIWRFFEMPRHVRRKNRHCRRHLALFRQMRGGSPLSFLHSAHRPQNTFRTDKQFDGYCSLQLMTSGGVDLSYGERHWILEGGPWFWCGYPGPHIRFHVAPGYESWAHRHVAFSGPRMSEWLADDMFPSNPSAPPMACRRRSCSTRCSLWCPAKVSGIHSGR